MPGHFDRMLPWDERIAADDQCRRHMYDEEVQLGVAPGFVVKGLDGRQGRTRLHDRKRLRCAGVKRRIVWAD